MVNFCISVPNLLQYLILDFRSRSDAGNRTARRPRILCSICFHWFGALSKVVRLFMASLHNEPMYPKMCLIFSTPPTGWLKFERGTFRTPVSGVIGTWCLGMAHSIVRPECLLTVFELSKSITGYSSYLSAKKQSVGWSMGRPALAFVQILSITTALQQWHRKNSRVLIDWSIDWLLRTTHIRWMILIHITKRKSLAYDKTNNLAVLTCEGRPVTCNSRSIFR